MLRFARPTHPPNRGAESLAAKINKTIPMPQELWDRIDAEAARESRVRVDMTRVLVVEALNARDRKRKRPAARPRVK